MKKVVLISGKAEHGKTTFANILRDILVSEGYRVVITRYAYYLKDLATRYCSWDGNKDETGRRLLQQLGTDIIRQKLNKPNFHVGRICEDIEICQNYVDYVIIDDTRFENEVYYPKAMFGDKVVSIRVNRVNEDLTPYNSSLTDEQKKHLSEVSLDNFNFDYVVSSSNIDDLTEQIKNMIIPAID